MWRWPDVLETGAGAGSGSHLVELEGEGCDQLAADETSLVLRTMIQACAEHDVQPPRLRVVIRNEVPLSRGLGSSAVDCERLDPLKGVRVVVAVPDFELSTHESRRVRPTDVSREDAVHALSHSAMTVAAMATGNLHLLERAMDDRLHEPHRAALIPDLAQVREAALAAGALGAFLGGAGPSVAALVLPENVEQVEGAMEQVWRRRAINCLVMDLGIEPAGLWVVASGSEQPYSQEGTE